MLFSQSAARGGSGVLSLARSVSFARQVFAVTFIASSAFAHAANSAPVIGGTPVTSVAAARYYSFQPWAIDADRDRLTFGISNQPAWARFDAPTGRLFGTPIPANVGTYGNIVISVSDGKVWTSLPAFTVKVLPLDNHAPTMSGMPPSSVIVGQGYTFQPKASDPDGNRIVFGIYNKPSWLTLDSATGRLQGTPNTSSIGTYKNIVLSVSDGYASTTLPAFSIAVSAAPASAPPDTSATLAWTPPTKNTDSSLLTDLAGYRVYYGTAPSSLIHRIEIGNAGLARYVVDNLSPGTWYFALTAYNRNGLESDLSAIVSKVTR